MGRYVSQHSLIQQKLRDIVFAFKELLIGWRERQQSYNTTPYKSFTYSTDIHYALTLRTLSSVLDSRRIVVAKTDMVPAFMKLPSEVSRKWWQLSSR